MWIKKKEIRCLSADIRRIIDGQPVDLRDDHEGDWSVLKNDIHTLASLKNGQADVLKLERDAMSVILTDISHQLKTPLTSMMIMADLLESTRPSKQDEFVTNIKIGLTRMEWLVTALLKIAKLDSGSIIFKTEKIPVGQLLDLALEPLHIMLDIKNQSVELIVSVDDFYCDRCWTAEALTNILKNASDYSPEKGDIRIKVGENPICQWIAVTDSGAGVPAHKKGLIFKRFEGSQSERGYGIGLPLALAIMRGQNGDIEIDSKGNTFTLKLYKPTW